MAVTSVTSIWTVFLNAFRRLLVVLGVTTSPRAQTPGTAPSPSPLSGLIPAQAQAPSASWRWTAPSSPLPRERSLPPTIKQRIRAEAHGSSPSDRRIPCAGDEESAATLSTA